MMGTMETTFYDDPEICVTCRRLIVRGRMIPMEEVVSVEQTIDRAATIRMPGLLMGASLMGTWIALRHDSPATAFLLLVATVLSGVWMAATRTSFTVSIVRAAGSLPVVISQNEQFARAVLLAISNAISARRENAMAHG